jgi:hypothetical protein
VRSDEDALSDVPAIKIDDEMLELAEHIIKPEAEGSIPNRSTIAMNPLWPNSSRRRSKEGASSSNAMADRSEAAASDQAASVRFPSFLIASAIDPAASSYPSQPWVFLSRPGRVLTVKRLGSRPDLT